MNNYVPTQMHMKQMLIFFFHLKKNARESHEALVEAYNDHALSEEECIKWFKRFEEGNFDLDAVGEKEPDSSQRKKAK